MTTGKEIIAKASAGNVLLGLVLSVLGLLGGVYGSAKLALHEANKKAEISSAKTDTLTTVLYTYIKEQGVFNQEIKDTLSMNVKQTRALIVGIDKLNKDVYVIKEASKTYPPMYSTLTYLTKIVEQQTIEANLQKKK